MLLDYYTLTLISDLRNLIAASLLPRFPHLFVGGLIFPVTMCATSSTRNDSTAKRIQAAAAAAAAAANVSRIAVAVRTLQLTTDGKGGEGLNTRLIQTRRDDIVCQQPAVLPNPSTLEQQQVQVGKGRKEASRRRRRCRRHK
jgi:hypothetical protein